jgi:uncharacterized protein
MQRIMDGVPGRFVVQTNGLFLDRIEPEYLCRFHSILVSIDGTQEVTDRERGKRVYERVTRNAELIRQRGFGGDLIARMTVEQGTDIRENVNHLLGTGLFDHVHWQLSFSMFWKGAECTDGELASWVANYNSGISSLIDEWVERMSTTGQVQGLVPFVALMGSMLSGRDSRLRCGSGIDFFTIVPDGRISACPVSIDYDFSMVGSVKERHPSSLRNSVLVGEPCLSCDIYQVCGGRCLFVNKAQDMLRENGFDLICSTVRHLVMELRSAQHQVQDLIDDGTLRLTDFHYPELNNGCEIIP